MMLRLSCSLVLTYVCLIGVAHAQPLPPEPTSGATDARTRFARGEEAYNQGDYRLAIQEWEAAYAADPRPRIQYNIYQAHERLGEFGAAADALQRYLDAADRSDPFYDNAQARMANLQSRLQATGVRLSGIPDGARIFIDDRELGELPQDVLALVPGQHRIVVAREGYADFVSNVVVIAGQIVDVPVTLEPVPDRAPPLTPAPEAAPPQAREPATAEADSPEQHRPTDAERAAKPFLLASAGLAGGALLAGIWALNRDAVLEGCGDSEFYCPNEDTVSSERTVATIATATLGAGAAGLFVYGLIVRFRDAPSERSAWSCAPTKSGAWCSVRF